MRLKSFSLAVLVGLVSSSAQASVVPLGFLRAMQVSVRSAEILQEIRVISGRSLELHEIARILDTQREFRALRHELLGRAADYANALTPLRGSEVTAFESMGVRQISRRVIQLYEETQGADLAAVTRLMDSRFEMVGLYSLAEFLPQRGARDFVGLGRSLARRGIH